MSRLWGIRHVRYAYLKWCLLCWFAQYRGPGWHINDSDWRYLDAVWKGEI